MVEASIRGKEHRTAQTDDDPNAGLPVRQIEYSCEYIRQKRRLTAAPTLNYSAPRRGPAFDAVDAKQQVKHRPYQRHQPDDDDPQHRRERITLPNHCMALSQQRGGDGERADQIPPAVKEAVKHSMKTNRHDFCSMKNYHDRSGGPAPFAADSIPPPLGCRQSNRLAAALKCRRCSGCHRVCAAWIHPHVGSGCAA